MNNLEKSCYALFRGRINIPKAAGYCGLSVEEMKEKFKDYVSKTPVDDWELDIVPCWPYA